MEEEILLQLQSHTHKNMNNNKAIGATHILRSSIHTFLSNFQHFTSTPTLLALPFSISLLLLLPTSIAPFLLPHFHFRLNSLFSAAGFPSSSPLFSLLSLKLSQTLVSSISTLPFSLSFLLLSKSSVIQSLHSHPSSSSSSFFHLLLTQICNSILLLATHSTCFSLLSLAFTTVHATTSPPSSTWVLFISASGAVLYSLIVAKAVLICNLSLIVSGRERRSGYLPIIKACVMLKGKTLTALSLALPVNIAMAAVEFLFNYRIIDLGRFRPTWIVAGEGLLIGYLYSVLIVIDVIVGCFFYQRCIQEQQQEEPVYKDYASDENKLRALEQGFTTRQ